MRFLSEQAGSFGFTPNPWASATETWDWNFLRTDSAAPTRTRPGHNLHPSAMADADSSARNVGWHRSSVPHRAPAYFQKEFFHNGYIKSLKQLVHFYNTRDVFPFKVTPDTARARLKKWTVARAGGPNNLDMTSQARLDGPRGGSDSHLHANAHGWLHETLPNSDTLRVLHDRWFGQDARQSVPHSDSPLPPCASAVCGVPPLPVRAIHRATPRRMQGAAGAERDGRMGSSTPCVCSVVPRNSKRVLS